MFLGYAAQAAAASYVCQQAADKEDLVHIRYNYGELGFDPSKSLQEINRICQDNAAGCFQGNTGVRRLSVRDKTLRVNREKCVVPEVDVAYDFSGTMLYITKEHPPCAPRAVLRHEFQHFMI